MLWRPAVVRADGGIVFLGDSLTAGGKWSEFYEQAHVLNMGVVSDTTTRVQDRLGPVIKQRPEKLFLMIGINDLGAGLSVPVISVRYGKIVRQLARRLPRTKLYLQSVLPVNRQLYRRKLNPAHIMALNNAVRTLASQVGAEYIDLFSKFSTPDHQLHREYTTDGVHLNARGYQLWKECLAEYVDE